MVDKIKFQRTTESGRKPSTAQCDQGELAINLTDKSVFTQDQNGEIVELSGSFKNLGTIGSDVSHPTTDSKDIIGTGLAFISDGDEGLTGGAYGYGGLLQYQATSNKDIANKGMWWQLYGSHLGDLMFRSGWGENAENWMRVFTTLNPPSKAQVGLGNVQNYNISDNYQLNNSASYASSKALNDAYKKLNDSKVDNTNGVITDTLRVGNRTKITGSLVEFTDTASSCASGMAFDGLDNTRIGGFGSHWNGSDNTFWAAFAVGLGKTWYDGNLFKITFDGQAVTKHDGRLIGENGGTLKKPLYLSDENGNGLKLHNTYGTTDDIIGGIESKWLDDVLDFGHARSSSRPSNGFAVRLNGANLFRARPDTILFKDHEMYHEGHKPTASDLYVPTLQHKQIKVVGDSDKFYPVYFPLENDVIEEFVVWRWYNAPIGADSDPNWNDSSTTHKGALKLRVKASGNGWGGSVPICQYDFGCQYTKCIGNIVIGGSGNYNCIVWLRGAPNGAIYECRYLDRTVLPNVTTENADYPMDAISESDVTNPFNLDGAHKGTSNTDHWIRGYKTATEHYVDENFLAIDGKAVDSELLDGRDSTQFAHTRTITNIGAGDFTTAQFVEWLDGLGAFDAPHFSVRTNFAYADNGYIRDSQTGCGDVQLAGAAIEVMSANGGNQKIIRVMTASSGQNPRQIFVYNDCGSAYTPSWYRLYSTAIPPTAAEVNAYSKDESDENYVSRLNKQYGENHNFYDIVRHNGFFNGMDITNAPTRIFSNYFVSSHGHYLSSFLYNNHRTNDWYVGWSEKSNGVERLVKDRLINQEYGDDRYLGITNKAASALVADHTKKVSSFVVGSMNESTGRNTVNGGFAHFSTYTKENTTGMSYPYHAQFTDGEEGFEFAVNWYPAQEKFKMRVLRDCCDDWGDWLEVLLKRDADKNYCRVIKFHPEISGGLNYVRLLSINKTDSSCSFILNGCGDFGNRRRVSLDVSVATRANDITVDAYYLNRTNASDAPILYTKFNDTSDMFEVWGRFSDFNNAMQMVVTSDSTSDWTKVVWHGDSATTTAPSNLATEKINSNDMYHTGNKPSAADVDTYTRAEIDELLGSRVIYQVGDIYITTRSGTPNEHGHIGEWVKLDNDVSLNSHSSNVGNYQGSNTQNVPLPSHSHTRGTMDITGRFSNNDKSWADGAFWNSGTTGVHCGDGSQWADINSFQASKTWTGRTSSEGVSNPTINVQGRVFNVFIWRRTK